jgi:[ribosomal protein S5]-alanine N-acetyltransferase
MRLETLLADCALRPWEPADVADLVANANNRKVWRNLTESFPYPYIERDAEQWVEIATNSGRSVHLAITLAGKAVGGVGAIAGQGIAERTAQFGYWLGEAYWGRGIASAAAAAFVTDLERQHAFARLEAPVFEWNPASMRVLEKVGFFREGILRRSVSKDGELIDSVMYAYLIGTQPFVHSKA